VKVRAHVKRQYDSGRRRQAAAKRQSLILESARRLFERHGYSATTMEAIAGEAGVAVETVYLAFKTKASLLSRVVDVALAGDEAPVALPDRPIFQEVRAEKDQGRQLELLARNARIVLERAGPLQWALLMASGTEPEIADLVERNHRRRLEVQTEFMRWVAANGPLAPGVSVQTAGRTYWTLASIEVHHLVRSTLGRTAKEYEQWLARTLKLALLPAQGALQGEL
jgi:AcrR family transcriptional regulator